MKKMKSGFKRSFGAIALLSSLSSWAEPPSLVSGKFKSIYIPEGFDSNDQAQIVGEGQFSDSCYRPQGVKVEVDTSAHQITVTSMALLYDGFCLQVLVPYSQVADLGILKPGKYEIFQKGVSEPLGSIQIRSATTADPDDFLYAPISQAYLSRDPAGKYRLTLTGEFTNSCMKLTDVIIKTQSNVVTVQPVSELKDPVGCVEGVFPFERSVDLPALKPGRYLLHVRALNAKAFNSLVDIQP